jgi:hypothetical protein
VESGRAAVLRAWLAYAGVGLLVTAAVAGAATLVVDREAGRAIVAMAGIAYAVQLLAFAALLAVRGKDALFLAGWLGGMILRFAGLGAVAWWVTATAALPREAALISLAGFLFLLLLLEPFFLRRGVRTT